VARSSILSGLRAVFKLEDVAIPPFGKQIQSDFKAIGVPKSHDTAFIVYFKRFPPAIEIKKAPRHDPGNQPGLMLEPTY
jgi:hypothetical protein